MSTAVTSGFKLLKRVKASSFDSKSLHSYTLCLLIGVKDFQFAAITGQNSCLYIEDYKLEGLKTINDRLTIIKEIFNKHPLLRSYKWGNIKLCFKSQKFSLIPHSFFVPERAGDYLILNNEVNTKAEGIFYYRQIQTEAVNVFAADKKVIEWVRSIYPGKSPQVLHQGSVLLEGVLKYDDHSHETMVFGFIDRGLLHLIASKKGKLLFYNQFVVTASDDYLKYILTVFKELRLNPKEVKLILWGIFNPNSDHITLIKKYVRHITLGARPNFVKFPEEFSDLPDHRYFDLYSIFLCD
ncbi:DUF3822 family protein [Marinoscillum sp. MHG1-6]|uniref:DUF3822 family protein n=1 Tax=Marinoscillum sp. MHG1-6 TaxID=2959627 RepID=UPI002157A9E3|nr:DUF3822 family protein [Marinoscillum sp. MHG1-6]